MYTVVALAFDAGRGERAHYDQAGAVLYKPVAVVAKLCTLACALKIQSCFWVAPRVIGFVIAHLPMAFPFAVAPGTRYGPPSFLEPKRFCRTPSLDQGAADLEVLVGQQLGPACACLLRQGRNAERCPVPAIGPVIDLMQRGLGVATRGAYRADSPAFAGERDPKHIAEAVTARGRDMCQVAAHKKALQLALHMRRDLRLPPLVPTPREKGL